MFFNRILSMFGLGARRSPYGGYARRGGLVGMLPLAFLAWRNRDAISSQFRRFRGNRAQGGALPQGI
jgi:hypothetical protein